MMHQKIPNNPKAVNFLYPKSTKFLVTPFPADVGVR